ncbi:MAG TPA: primosomal protein N' [Steroidobacteraceae bacterium]
MENREPVPRVLRVAIHARLCSPLEYLPPEGVSADSVLPGTRVRVPVGRREAIGVVIEPAAEATVAISALRAVRELLDPQPLLDPALMRLLEWAAGYYHHPLGEVIAAALPPALRQGGPAQALIERWRVTGDGRAALAAAALARAPRQRSLLLMMSGAAEGIDAEDLGRQVAGWREAARALRARGWIERLERPADESLPQPVTAPAPALPLSEAQQQAVTRIDGSAHEFAAWVLRGATGSGKTEVYLQCALRTLARARSVLLLVPEIGLTPQLVQRCRERLQVPVVVLHSGLSDAERLCAWRACRQGSARVLLGTRSAVFAPLSPLGLIVVDEEHDGSYKQYDGGCRYSARDLALVRARQLSIPVLLGSATPSFETLHNLQAGRYQGLVLPRRDDQAPAPRLALVDLRSHVLHQGLATPVIETMRAHLAANRQVLVFINRRGYAPTLLCTACGWIAPCPACDARLTVHRAEAQLRCHHCGRLEPLPARCRRCGHEVKPVGQGTERVEETVRELFAEHALVRLDRDSAARAGGSEAIVASVLSGAARILVGTQMITKGHHFPGVSLVVVLNADQGLFSTDFRAAERLAQTIVQVAGRAGREHLQGEVLIQTEYPEHPLLQSLLAGGYDGFAAAALAERAAAQWPPFARLAALRASARSADAALKFLAAARQCAPVTGDVRLLGPVAAAMAKRADRYHAQLLIESAERAPLHRLLDQWLPQVDTLARAGRVRYALDVDPIDIQ